MRVEEPRTSSRDPGFETRASPAPEPADPLGGGRRRVGVACRPSDKGSQMTEYVTSADGTRIAYDSVGSGPPVILIGGAMQFRGFDPTTIELAHLLAGHGFAVINYDRRGRGESPADAPITLAQSIDDLRALADMATEGADDAVALFGNSSGGSIALAAAAAGLPISKMVFFEVPLDAEGGAEGAVFLAELRERIAAGDRVGTLEVYMADMPRRVARGREAEPGLADDARDRAEPRTRRRVLAWTQSAPRAELWRGITAPTLALVGEETLPIMTSAAASVVASMPNATSRTIPGANHSLGPAHPGPGDRRVPRRLSERMPAGERRGPLGTAATRPPFRPAPSWHGSLARGGTEVPKCRVARCGEDFRPARTPSDHRGRPIADGWHATSGRERDPARGSAPTCSRARRARARSASASSRSSSRSTSSTVAMMSRPRPSKSWRMVVSGGAKYSASGMSSKPTTLTSSGTRSVRPRSSACMTPSAIWSFADEDGRDIRRRAASARPSAYAAAGRPVADERLAARRARARRARRASRARAPRHPSTPSGRRGAGCRGARAR